MVPIIAHLWFCVNFSLGCRFCPWVSLYHVVLMIDCIVRCCFCHKPIIPRARVWLSLTITLRSALRPDWSWPSWSWTRSWRRRCPAEKSSSDWTGMDRGRYLKLHNLLVSFLNKWYCVYYIFSLIFTRAQIPDFKEELPFRVPYWWYITGMVKNIGA